MVADEPWLKQTGQLNMHKLDQSVIYFCMFTIVFEPF